MKKGISLTMDDWRKLVAETEHIDAKIAEMSSRGIYDLGVFVRIISSVTFHFVYQL